MQNRIPFPVRALCCVAITLLIGWTMFTWNQSRPSSGHDRLQARCEALNAESQLLYNRALAARHPVHEVIRSAIIPEFEQVLSEVNEFDPANGSDVDWKNATLEFLTTMSDGWSLMADALEQENIVIEGQAWEKFEAALDGLERHGFTVNRTDPDMHREIALFLAADTRIENSFNERMADDVTDAEMADVVESELLPPWTVAQGRFAVAAMDPPVEYQRSVERLTEYAELRSQSFTLLVEALREADAAKSVQAKALMDDALELRQTIMRDGLTEPPVASPPIA